MMKTQQSVLEFMRALDLPLPHDGRPNPAVDKFTEKDFKRLRSLVEEEAIEFNGAMWELQIALQSGNLSLLHCWAEVIDAMCDLIVVIHNTSNAMNLDLEPYFEEVMRTNMMKGDGPVREDGKRLKPLNWEPPRIKEMLLDELRRKEK